MHGFTRKTLAGLLLAGGVALGAAPAAYANARDGFHHGLGERGMHLRGLNLSKEQRDQIFKIRHERAPVFREQAEKLRAAREELRKLALAESFDEAKVREAANAQARAMADLAVLRAQTLNRVRNVLTPEQRSQLEQRRERRRGPASR